MRIVRFFCLAALLGTQVWAQPQISPLGVTNNASYISPIFPAGAIARGSIFAIWGTNLGPATGATASTYPLPESLAGTSIRVRAGGQEFKAFPLYTTSGQVGAILPSTVPEGQAEISVEYQGKSSTWTSFPVVSGAFGIFTRNQRGTGPAVAYITAPDGKPLNWNTLFRSARPGDVLSIWGTGLGPIPGPDNEKALAGNLPSEAQVLVGGKSAAILYKGRSPGYAGLDQINFVVPDGVAGCYVPLAVVVNGRPSAYTTLSLHPEGALCSDPNSYMRSDLAPFADKHLLANGELELQRIRFFASFLPSEGLLLEDARGRFIERADLPFLGGWTPVVEATTTGSCMVHHFALTDDLDLLPYDLIPGRPMQAGDSMTVTGPKGSVKVNFDFFDGFQGFRGEIGGGIPPEDDPPFLEPGDYVLDNGAGHQDAGAFRTPIRLREMIRWTNRQQIESIDRTKSLTVAWEGGDPAAELAIIVGLASLEDQQQRAAFVCTAPVAAATFTVPSTVLASLPPVPASTVLAFPPGSLYVGTLSRPDLNRFTTKSVNFGFVHYLQLTGIGVEIH